MKRLLAARGAVVAYLMVLGFLLGVLVDRTPADLRQPAVAAFAPGRPGGGAPRAEHHTPEQAAPPLWLQLFRPSPLVARRILRAGLPMLPLGEDQQRHGDRAGPSQLVVYGQGEGVQRPPTLFSGLLPFLEELGDQGGAPGGPPGSRAGAPFSPPAADRPSAIPPVWTGPSPTAGTAGGRVQAGAPAGGPAGRGGPEPVGSTATRDEKAPLVGIYHTHDYESYVSEFPGRAFARGDLWLVISDDPASNVMRVGRELASALQERGISSVHATAMHQEEGYLGAYQLSLKTARQILSRYPSVRILVDLHRDDAPRELSVAVVDGVEVARILLVVGMGHADLPQNNWTRNMAFARELSQAMDDMYPGLSRGIRQSTNRYNQHLLPGSILIEVGSAENTMVEALNAARLLADVMAKLIEEGRYPVP